MVDYRAFRLNKLNTPEFEHVKLLLFWPFFGLVFQLLERCLNLDFHVVSCELAAKIPFCEYFLIPYLFWLVFLIGLLIYSFFYDIPTFKKYMKFIICTYTITLIIFMIYPTMQELRPESFERDNLFTRIVGFLYGFDTNTNVCPSIHVLGSFAVYFAARDSKKFSSFAWRIVFFICAVLISVSTVFLKQHSAVDIAAALVLCIADYPFVFRNVKVKQLPVEEEQAEQYVS